MAIKKFYLLIIRKERAKTGEDKKKKEIEKLITGINNI